MKKLTMLLMLTALAGIILISCGKKRRPTPFRSKALQHLQMMQPVFQSNLLQTGLKTAPRVSDLFVFSSEQGKKRFNKYDTEGFPVAKIDIIATDMKDGMTLDSISKMSKIFGVLKFMKLRMQLLTVCRVKNCFTHFRSAMECLTYDVLCCKEYSKGKQFVTIECFGDSYETYKSSFG